MQHPHSELPATSRRSKLNTALLVCGILSSLLYTAAVILGALRWEGYSSTSQTVSELIAIGAPSAPLVIPLFTLYALLIYAFGWGVWKSAGHGRALRAAAVLIAAKEILGLGVTLVAPIHLRGNQGELTDTLHAIFTAAGVLLCMFPAMGLAAAALGGRFRLYSIVTILVFLVFGALAGLQGQQLAANLPTPWMGVYERVNIGGYMLWIITLAAVLLRRQPVHGS